MKKAGVVECALRTGLWERVMHSTNFETVGEGLSVRIAQSVGR